MKWFFRLKRIWLLLCFPAAWGLLYAASRNTEFAQWYAAVIYPPLSLAINKVTSLLPFSIAEFIVFFVIAACIIYLLYYIVKISRKGKEERKKNAVKFVLNPVCAACVLYFVFALSCGMSYYRPSFADENGIVAKASTKNELIALCEELCEQANQLRSQVETDDAGVMRLQYKNMDRVAEQARDAYAALHNDYAVLTAGYGAPKPVLCSRLMSYSNITGVFFPFTFEANVNVDIPDYSIPVTMCHELTHVRGYMQEEEANFVAYLACLKSDSADFQYSGTMLACIYAGNALYSVDQTAYSSIYGQLSDGIKRDINFNRSYWKQFEGPVAEVSNKVNDSYLKANGQQDGVKSYGRMVDLLLADYRTRHNLDESI